MRSRMWSANIRGRSAGPTKSNTSRRKQVTHQYREIGLVCLSLAAHAQRAGPGRAAGVGENDSKLEHSLAVYQAQGMVTVQSDCAFPEALVKMKERAQAAGQTLEGIAHAVLERRIRFDE
jgi:hypothetical protein